MDLIKDIRFMFSYFISPWVVLLTIGLLLWWNPISALTFTIGFIASLAFLVLRGNKNG